MTPAVIREAAEDGVSLALSPAGTIKATGDQAAVNRWLPVLRAHKPDILAALTHRDLSGVSPEFAVRLSAEDLEDIAAGDIPMGTVQAFEAAAVAREVEDLRQERAGILEFDAGMLRPEAELEAARITATLARNRGYQVRDTDQGCVPSRGRAGRRPATPLRWGARRRPGGVASSAELRGSSNFRVLRRPLARGRGLPHASRLGLQHRLDALGASQPPPQQASGGAGGGG
jgi:hypothetical protein